MQSVPHPSPLSGSSYSAAELSLENDRLILLDQRLLPDQEHYVFIEDWREAERAIADMLVRGAPAIGIAAAYAMVLATRQAHGDYTSEMRQAARVLARARPTAVNLRWAVEQCLELAVRHAELARAERTQAMAELARRIHRDDVLANRKLGRLGAESIPEGATLLTHCNAGALATGGYGTALGVVRALHEAGKRVRVIADETRPFLQGARLTAWELARDGIDVSVIADAAAGSLIARGAVDVVVVGADRIAANGDVANKIGTYALSCFCHVNQKPFYVAAPISTVDLGTATGAGIPIEERDANEVTHMAGRRLVASGVTARNPAFDVTPAHWVTAIFTERGRVAPVTAAEVSRVALAPA